jgi:dolichol-phosphate mannosyltransferase
LIQELSIVLPVINEKSNLEFLIPELLQICDQIGIRSEVIVVDDGSTDGTDLFIGSLSALDSRVSRLDRSALPRSLPGSLNDGFEISKYPFVLWMDADGSMPADTLRAMVATFNEEDRKPATTVVGSRFVEGGGFKGTNASGKTSLFEARRNLKATNDSFTAMVLSRMLNYYLYLALNRCCKDPASGFILTRRETVLQFKLEGSYGDYCPRFLFQLFKFGGQIIEVPYICIPRKYGESKTGANLYQLIKRGFPYAWMPLKIRLNEK